MMATMKHSTHSVTLEVPYEQAFDYLSDWRNQPQWAINFVKGMRKQGEQLFMTTPFGEVPVEWRTDRDLGTIDIIFPGNNVSPTRLTAMGDDTLVYTFTFSMPPDVSEEAFQEGQLGMEQELQHLKRILEAS